MPTFNLVCRGCRTVLELDTGFAGGVCRCFHCGTLMSVPAHAAHHAGANAGERPETPGLRPDAPAFNPSRRPSSPFVSAPGGGGGGPTPDDPSPFVPPSPAPIIRDDDLFADGPAEEDEPKEVTPAVTASAAEIDGFRIVAALGHGSASAVFEVREPGKGTAAGQTFALEQICRLKPSDDRYIEHLANEKAVSTRFSHPFLRRTYRLIRHRSFGLQTTQALLLMELVKGQPLETLPPRDVVGSIRVFRQVAEGVSRMHLAGFLHLDLQPRNILVTRAGGIKIIDFGQTCPIGTTKNRVHGIIHFIAPEQVKCVALGVPTDIYQLGASLFWAITGRHVPRAGRHRSGPKALHGIGQVPVPNPCELNPAAPLALGTLVLDCLQRDPQKRPPAMDLVVERLDMALHQLERHRSNAAGNTV